MFSKLNMCLGILLALFVACDETDADYVDVEQREITTFITQVMKDSTKYKLSTNRSGVNYIMTNPGDTTSIIEKGDSLYLWYAAKTLKGEAYFSTNDKQTAIEYGLDTTGTSEPLKVIAGSSGLVKGVDLGLMMMHNGDSGLLIFDSGLGYGKNNLGVIPGKSPILFNITIAKQVKKR